MQTTTTVGLDIAKSVFQVHGVDAQGNVVVRRQAAVRSNVLSKAAAVRGWHRGVRVITLLVARTSSALSGRQNLSALEHCVRRAGRT